jgi:chromosome segregation ATPase
MRGVHVWRRVRQSLTCALAEMKEMVASIGGLGGNIAGLKRGADDQKREMQQLKCAIENILQNQRDASSEIKDMRTAVSTITKAVDLVQLDTRDLKRSYDAMTDSSQASTDAVSWPILRNPLDRHH